MPTAHAINRRGYQPAFDRSTSPGPAGPYVAEMRDGDDRWLEETRTAGTIRDIVDFLAGNERPYAELVEVYELDLSDPLAPKVMNATAMVLGMVVDRINRDDGADGIPDSLADACRRYGFRVAPKAPLPDLNPAPFTGACLGVSVVYRGTAP